MSQEVVETTQESIQAMLETLDEGDLRYQLLKSSLGFKSAWVSMAQNLNEIVHSEVYRDWGYRSFGAYCATELQLTKTLANKMVEGYQWLEEQAPEYLPQNQAGSEDEDDEPTPRTTPDVDTVHVLARGYQDVTQERIPRDTYSELKQAALSGERSTSQLRRAFKEAVPEHLRDTKPPNPIQHLKRALAEVEKALAQIQEGDENEGFLFQAAELRDSIFQVLTQNSNQDA